MSKLFAERAARNYDNWLKLRQEGLTNKNLIRLPPLFRERFTAIRIITVYESRAFNDGKNPGINQPRAWRHRAEESWAGLPVIFRSEGNFSVIWFLSRKILLCCCFGNTRKFALFKPEHVFPEKKLPWKPILDSARRLLLWHIRWGWKNFESVNRRHFGIESLLIVKALSAKRHSWSLETLELFFTQRNWSKRTEKVFQLLLHFFFVSRIGIH